MKQPPPRNDDAPLAGEATVNKSNIHRHSTDADLDRDTPPSHRSPIFVVPTPAARDALDSLDLRSVLIADIARLALEDHAVVLTPEDRLLEAGRTADEIHARGVRTSVALIPRGEPGVAAAVYAGAAATEFLAAAEHPIAGGGDSQPGAGGYTRYQPFPVNALPEPLATFVEAGAAAIGCDPAFIALPLLSAAGAAIGNTRRLKLKESWHVPPILWTAIIGDSGTQKSPAFKLALRALTEAQERAFAEYAAAKREWDTEHAKWEKEDAAWRRDPDRTEPPPEPPEPDPVRYIGNNATTEAIAPLLLRNPRGLLVAHDELSGWVNGFDRYSAGGKGGGDAAQWLSMFDGASVTIDRKTNQQTIHIPAASVSLSGGIQPQILARAIGREHRENGLLARLLLAMPPTRARCWSEDEVPVSLSDAVSEVFSRLLALSPERVEAGVWHPATVTLSPEAKREWVNFYNDHGHEQARMVGDLAAAWSKLEGYAARLALVIHMCRVVVEDPTIDDASLIDEASMRAGIELAKWFGNEARRVYGVFHEPEADTAARELAEWISRKLGGSATARDLTHGKRRFRGDPDAAEEALSDLEERGFGERRMERNPRGGPSTMRFYIRRHSVTVTETPDDRTMSGGCGDGDASDDTRPTHAA